MRYIHRFLFGRLQGENVDTAWQLLKMWKDMQEWRHHLKLGPYRRTETKKKKKYESQWDLMKLQ
jgi:hypothetical protein